MSHRVVMLFSIIVISLAVSVASADNFVLNGDFAADGQWWYASPYGTSANTLEWNAAHTASGTGGSLKITVTTAGTDNSYVGADYNGAVQFDAFAKSSKGPKLEVSAYVLIDTPLTQVSGISSGKGGAAVALIDGSVFTNNTGTITADNDRLLAATSGFQKVTAPVLDLTDSGQYNPFLLIRNATGTAYFDDVVVQTPQSTEPTPTPDPTVNRVLNPDFTTDASLWNPSPFGTSTNTIAWDSSHNNTGSAGGSLRVNVPTGSADNSSVASGLDGAVQFGGLALPGVPAQLDISAYVLIDTPLTEVSGISSGKGGAAVALIDGIKDFTGVITPDDQRLLSTSGFQKISAPTLTVAEGDAYNIYVMLRNAKGSAYFDDVTVKGPTPSNVPVELWNFYAE